MKPKKGQTWRTRTWLDWEDDKEFLEVKIDEVLEQGNGEVQIKLKPVKWLVFLPSRSTYQNFEDFKKRSQFIKD